MESNEKDANIGTGIEASEPPRRQSVVDSINMNKNLDAK